MTTSKDSISIALLDAGAKGTRGPTIAVMLETPKEKPGVVKPYLTALPLFPDLVPVEQMVFSGWDTGKDSLEEPLVHHSVLPREKWHPYLENLKSVDIRPHKSFR